MHVLYNEGPSSDRIYQYKCNVGPLLNTFAICRNLSIQEFVPLKTTIKQPTLLKIAEQPFYVSYSELVNIDETYKPYETKEVLWFVW